MKKQPQNKTTTNVGEINKLCDENQNITTTIYQIIEKFNIEGKIKVLNTVKLRGYKISELIVILLVIPFFRVRIDNMHRKDRGQNTSKAKKDAYYDLKNNELINWRMILALIVKQFLNITQNNVIQDITKIKALVGDDTMVMKTGHKIENVSKVHDHTTDGFLFGFKILVLGFYDGTTFIPVDFSIHREKGKGCKAELKKRKKALVQLNQSKQQFQAKEQELKNKKNETKVLKLQQKPANKALVKKMEQNKRQIAKLKTQLSAIKKRILLQESDLAQAKAEYNKSQKQHPAFGLKLKERKAQFKKKRIKNSFGWKREKEVDTKKTDNLLKMLARAIKSGIKAQYFIVDSWFFSAKMVQGVRNLPGAMHYMGMAPMRENILYQYNNQMLNSQSLYKIGRKNRHRCRKYHSQYIQMEVEFAQAPMQLFFVKLGKAKTWKLLATTDMSLNFIRLFELYQIRWSIEVFFKECKQYLGFGKCQSQDFDAQICSTTLSMVQYILLCYYKRIHYQQKLEGIFEQISYQTMEASIVEKMITKFMELLDILAKAAGVDAIEIYMLMIQNPKALKLSKELKLDGFMERKKAA